MRTRVRHNGDFVSIVRATFSSLAKILSVRDDQVEDALACERLARLSMDRRGFFRSVSVAAAAVALPKGLAFSEGSVSFAPHLTREMLGVMSLLAEYHAMIFATVISFGGARPSTTGSWPRE